MNRDQRSPDTHSSLEDPAPRVRETLKRDLPSNVLSHITSHSLTVSLTAETNLKDPNDPRDSMSDVEPRRRDPPFRKKLRSNKDHMENSVTLRRSNHQILHEKPEFMFNSLTESLKTASQERDIKTNARCQSQEATTLMSERSPHQSRETTLKATRLFRRKRAKSSLDEQTSHRKNLLNKGSLRNRRFLRTITPRDIARTNKEVRH
jgi:hypothetical protein